jgi:hypothetical protein
MLNEVFQKIISDSVNQSNSFDDYCAIYCPEHYKKPYKDIINTFKESYNFFQNTSHKTSRRLIAKLLDEYIVFTENSGKITSKIIPNFIQLSTYISLDPQTSIQYKFIGKNDRQLELMQFICQNAQDHDITVFYQTKGNYVFIYIINEAGNIFFYFTPINENERILGYLYGFVEKTLKRIREINRFSPLSHQKTRFYEISEDRFGHYNLTDNTEIHQNWYLTLYKSEDILKCSISEKLGDENFYNVVFPDGIESGFLTLNDFSAIAEKVIQVRKEGNKLRNIIVEVNFLDKTTDNTINSTIFFEEKFKIEISIERFLKQ